VPAVRLAVVADADGDATVPVVGWLVSFDGPISDAEANRIIEIIASQIETEVGESIEFVQVGWQE